MNLEQVEFGPFRGYQSAQEPHLSPPNYLVGNTGGDSTTNSSADILLDPLSGFWYRRQGCSNKFDTLDGSQHEVTGLLESGMSFGARARRLFALRSNTLGGSTPAILYGVDSNTSTFPTVDTGWFGTLWCRNTVTNENYNLLKDFASHYPTDPTVAFVPSTSGIDVVPPFWIESGTNTGLYTRGEARFTRQMLTAGSLSVANTGDVIAFPNLRSTPFSWDKTMNGTGATNTCRYRATGPFPPLPTATIADGSSGTGGSWVDGDTFFYSVIFQYRDGSFSTPTIPRPKNATLTNGLYLHTVGTPGGTATYQSLTMSHIPTGTNDVIGRVILMSPKQTLSSTSDTLTISPLDLRVAGILSNNTQSVFVMTDGSQDGLVENDALVRYDLVVPRRARHIGTGDQRVLIADTLPSPHGIILSLVGINSAADMNDNSSTTASINDDNAALYGGTKGGFYRITTTQLELYRFDTGVADKTISQLNIDWATYTNLQAVVDKINATSQGATSYAWRAQICPGVDPYLASSSLCPTVQTVATCQTTGSSATLTTAGSFADVPIGALIFEVGGSSITAGTYVVSKQSNTSLTMSAAMTVPATKTLTFYSFCGDGASFQTGSEFRTTAATASTQILGLIRSFGPANPVFGYIGRTSQTGYGVRDRTKAYFTVGSPGAANIGASLAINSWGADNSLAPTIGNSGPILGIVDIEGAAVVGYQNGLALFQNIKGVNSGEDFDYKLFTINSRRGIVSWSAILGGNGWACYVTREGVFATDRNRREFNIGKDIYNAGRNLGDLAKEISNSIIATDRDSDVSYLHLSLLRSRIGISYKDSTNNNLVNQFYNFSPGLDASGVEELADADNKAPYGWTPPCRYNLTAVRGFGPMALVPTATGLLHYGAYDGAFSGTNDGRIDQFDIGSTDNGVAFNGIAFMPIFTSPNFASISCQDLNAIHKSPQASGSSTQILTSHDAGFVNTNSYNLSGTSTDPFLQQYLTLVSADKGPSAMLWLQWLDAAANQGNGFWRIAARYQVLPK